METYSNMSIEQFREILQRCSGKRLSIDTETTGLRWWSDRLTTVGFHCPDAEVEGTIDFRDELDLDKAVKDVLLQALSKDTIVILHNAKFDLAMLSADPAVTGWKIMDTSVLIHLIDSRNKKSMEIAEVQLLGTNSKRQYIDDSEFGDLPVPLVLPGKEKKKKSGKAKVMVWDWNADKRQAYCLNDCRVTYQFAEAIYPFAKQLKLEKVFWKDMKYLGIVWHIERTGILTDPAFIGKASMSLMQHQKSLESQLFDACGKVFNWRSNQQLSQAIYNDLGIDRPVNPFADANGVDKSKFADKGKYNKYMTSSFILMEKAHHPLGELISSIREAAKLQKTLQQWLDLADENSYVHTNFNLTGTRTGRLSSSKPNIQNVPSEVRSRFTQGVFSGGNTRTEEYNLRNAFIARPGYTFLSVDYKQMEMRMFGIISGDQLLIQALSSGIDIHLWIAKQVWGECGKELDMIHREWSKTISFGLIYGMTTGSLQFKLNMTRSQAQKVTDDYWARFPRIRPWLFEVVAECKKNHYVRYWSGRIWKEDQEEHMYKGANALIQGGCADLLSIATMRVWDWLKAQGTEYDGRIVNLVHDEIISEVPKNDIHRAAQEIGILMQVPDLFNMPFLTDAKAGDSYGSLDKIKPL